MKTILATLAAVGALSAIAIPATAQPYGYDRSDRNYDRSYEDRDWGHGHGRYDSQRVRMAERYIERGIRDGSLSPREVARLRAELRDFARLEARVMRDGANWREREFLDQRFRRLVAQITHETRDRNYGYGYYR